MEVGVRKRQHSAVAVGDHEGLLRAEQVVRDNQRADRVVAGEAAGVADDVRVAFAQPGVLGGVESGVHARENGEAARRRQRQVGLLAESRGVFRVGGENFLEHG